MEWSDYRQALARGWWLIVVFAIVGVAVGFLLPTTVTQPQWVTQTSIGAPPGIDGGNSSPLPPGVTTEQIQFFADSDAVYADAARLAHITNEPQYVLRQMIQVTGPTDSTGQPGVLLVAVKAPTAAESAALNIGFDTALKYAVVGGAKLATGEDVYTGFQILQSTNSNSATPTKTVSQKFSSRPVRVVAGLLIGLLLGILAALARGLLDKRVSSAKRAQAALGYPVVAELPAESSDSSEAYRMLWLSVFREPLPEAVDQGDQWLEGADLRLDSGTWPGSEP
jgi:capsular polysaccharide biosynthesis protein